MATWGGIIEAQGPGRGFVFQERKQLIDRAPPGFLPGLARLATVEDSGAKKPVDLPAIKRTVKASRLHVVEIHACSQSKMGADR